MSGADDDDVYKVSRVHRCRFQPNSSLHSQCFAVSLCTVHKTALCVLEVATRCEFSSTLRTARDKR